MTKLGQPYTSGIWTVKPGKEEEFIQAWREFANWSGSSQVGAGAARLLQDLEHPNRLISFGDWDNPESIQQWRSTPEFAAFLVQARALCDDIQPGTFKVVAYLDG